MVLFIIDVRKINFFCDDSETFVKHFLKIHIFKFCHNIVDDIMSLILINIKIVSLYFLENQSGSMWDYNFARGMPQEKTIQFVIE